MFSGLLVFGVIFSLLNMMLPLRLLTWVGDSIAFVWLHLGGEGFLF